MCVLIRIIQERILPWVLAGAVLPLTCMYAFAQEPCGQPSVRRVVALTRYPRLAQLSAVQGQVDLAAQVAPDGSVQSVRRVSGPGILSHDAEQSLLRWRFSKCDSACGTREAKVMFNFILEGVCTLPDCSVEFQVDLPSSVTVRSQRGRAIIN
jgi:hypothetical protein